MKEIGYDAKKIQLGKLKKSERKIKIIIRDCQF